MKEIRMKVPLGDTYQASLWVCIRIRTYYDEPFVVLTDFDDNLYLFSPVLGNPESHSNDNLIALLSMNVEIELSQLNHVMGFCLFKNCGGLLSSAC
ncbi:hypothetical protein J1N35_010904 [Gossypium stocksii]|uniref:Uncharacterized protein n=1 Tax=Gossypium stocksii TaxID=47602 RepID=A0A9D3W0Z0_9ROSI|nr:hypothetical protein J1N35_010904 [Gossypium stocksii]